MKYVLGIVITLAFLGVGTLLFAWSGFYNIAATEPHWGITKSFIEALRDRSISVRSGDLQVPDLDDSKFKEAAFSHYHEMCRLCHSAPGYRPNEFSKGLYPAPPLMMSGDIQKSLSDAEIYCIVKHGIKLTGMPAFGPTHEEPELWGLVALAKEMPQMDSEQYRQLISKEGETGHGHTHGESEKEMEEGHVHDEPHEHADAEEGYH